MSRTTKRWRLEMISGVLTAVGLICAIVWVWLVVAALAIAFSETAYPRLVGWICLAAAGIIALVTVDKWVKVLPVFLGMSILNALLAVVNGHVGTSSSGTVSRIDASGVLLCLIASAVCARTFVSRALNRVDRVALMAFLISMGWSIVKGLNSFGPLAMLICLGIAWAYERSQGSAGCRSFRS